MGGTLRDFVRPDMVWYMDEIFAPVSRGVVVALAAGLVWLVVRRRRAVDGESSDVVDGDSSSKPAEPELELTSR